MNPNTNQINYQRGINNNSIIRNNNNNNNMISQQHQSYPPAPQNRQPNPNLFNPFPTQLNQPPNPSSNIVNLPGFGPTLTYQNYLTGVWYGRVLATGLIFPLVLPPPPLGIPITSGAAGGVAGNGIGNGNGNGAGFNHYPQPHLNPNPHSYLGPTNPQQNNPRYNLSIIHSRNHSIRNNDGFGRGGNNNSNGSASGTGGTGFGSTGVTLDVIGSSDGVATGFGSSNNGGSSGFTGSSGTSTRSNDGKNGLEVGGSGSGILGGGIGLDQGLNTNGGVPNPNPSSITPPALLLDVTSSLLPSTSTSNGINFNTSRSSSISNSILKRKIALLNRTGGNSSPTTTTPSTMAMPNPSSTPTPSQQAESNSTSSLSNRNPTSTTSQQQTSIPTPTAPSYPSRPNNNRNSSNISGNPRSRTQSARGLVTSDFAIAAAAASTSNYTALATPMRGGGGGGGLYLATDIPRNYSDLPPVTREKRKRTVSSGSGISAGDRFTSEIDVSGAASDKGKGKAKAEVEELEEGEIVEDDNMMGEVEDGEVVYASINTSSDAAAMNPSPKKKTKVAEVVVKLPSTPSKSSPSTPAAPASGILGNSNPKGGRARDRGRGRGRGRDKGKGKAREVVGRSVVAQVEPVEDAGGRPDPDQMTAPSEITGYDLIFPPLTNKPTNASPAANTASPPVSEPIEAIVRHSLKRSASAASLDPLEKLGKGQGQGKGRGRGKRVIFASPVGATLSPTTTPSSQSTSTSNAADGVAAPPTLPPTGPPKAKKQRKPKRNPKPTAAPSPAQPQPQSHQGPTPSEKQASWFETSRNSFAILGSKGVKVMETGKEKEGAGAKVITIPLGTSTFCQSPLAKPKHVDSRSGWPNTFLPATSSMVPPPATRYTSPVVAPTPPVGLPPTPPSHLSYKTLPVLRPGAVGKGISTQYYGIGHNDHRSVFLHCSNGNSVSLSATLGSKRVQLLEARKLLKSKSATTYQTKSRVVAGKKVFASVVSSRFNPLTGRSEGFSSRDLAEGAAAIMLLMAKELEDQLDFLVEEEDTVQVNKLGNRRYPNIPRKEKSIKPAQDIYETEEFTVRNPTDWASQAVLNIDRDTSYWMYDAEVRNLPELKEDQLSTQCVALSRAVLDERAFLQEEFPMLRSKPAPEGTTYHLAGCSSLHVSFTNPRLVYLDPWTIHYLQSVMAETSTEPSSIPANFPLAFAKDATLAAFSWEESKSLVGRLSLTIRTRTIAVEVVGTHCEDCSSVTACWLALGDFEKEDEVNYRLASQMETAGDKYSDGIGGIYAALKALESQRFFEVHSTFKALTCNESTIINSPLRDVVFSYKMDLYDIEVELERKIIANSSEKLEGAVWRFLLEEVEQAVHDLRSTLEQQAWNRLEAAETPIPPTQTPKLSPQEEQQLKDLREIKEEWALNTFIRVMVRLKKLPGDVTTWKNLILFKNRSTYLQAVKHCSVPQCFSINSFSQEVGYRFKDPRWVILALGNVQGSEGARKAFVRASRSLWDAETMGELEGEFGDSWVGHSGQSLTRTEEALSTVQRKMSFLFQTRLSNFLPNSKELKLFDFLQYPEKKQVVKGKLIWEEFLCLGFAMIQDAGGRKSRFRRLTELFFKWLELEKLKKAQEKLVCGKASVNNWPEDSTYENPYCYWNVPRKTNRVVNGRIQRFKKVEKKPDVSKALVGAGSERKVTKKKLKPVVTVAGEGKVMGGLGRVTSRKTVKGKDVDIGKVAEVLAKMKKGDLRMSKHIAVKTGNEGAADEKKEGKKSKTQL